MEVTNKNLIAILSDVRKVNTSYGNYAITCEIEYMSNFHGLITSEVNKYFWRKYEAIEWLKSIKN